MVIECSNCRSVPCMCHIEDLAQVVEADARALRQIREALAGIAENADTLHEPLEYERCVLESVYEIAGVPIPPGLCAAPDAHPSAVAAMTRIIHRLRTELRAERTVITEIGFLDTNYDDDGAGEIVTAERGDSRADGLRIIAEARRRIAQRAKSQTVAQTATATTPTQEG